MDFKTRAHEHFKTVENQLIELSHKIHAHPELAFEEVQTSSWLIEILTQAGFTVQKGMCDLPTAFKATIGTGALQVAICAEMDALPEIGHACGHNIIAAMAAGAGIALSKLIDELDMTLHIIGTPAEESGGGKTLLIQGGAFQGIHAAMMVHPAPFDILNPAIISALSMDIHYFGKASHASAVPELGVNALDALLIAQTAIGLLRQQLKSTERVHGIITHGGDAANVIPSRTSARFIVRSTNLKQLEKLSIRVKRCFEAGALATGAKLKIVEDKNPYAEMHYDTEISELYRKNAEKLGRVFLDNLETTGKKIPFRMRMFRFLLKQAGFSTEDLKPVLNRFAGSTDMGNVSLVIPSIHPAIGIHSGSAINHQKEFTDYCVLPGADQALKDGALAMAWTVIDLATDEKSRDRLIGRLRETGL